MATPGTYQEYARQAIENFAQKDAASRYLLVDAVKDVRVERVLDVGCGAGQEMLPFVERTRAFCVGVDVAEKLGEIGKGFFEKADAKNRVFFVRSRGEGLPFATESFDVVLCRVALPYMNNQSAIAEIARVLKPNGIFLLKTHAPSFYFGMLRARVKLLSLKQLAYPLVCLAGGAWHSLTGKQLKGGIWDGKEIFQTRGFLEKELAKNDLKIEGFLSDTNRQTPSFVIMKIGRE